MRLEPLAHSPKPPSPEQTYRKHVEGVKCGAVRNARAACKYFSGDRDAFLRIVEAAAIYHDLGKLDELNQNVLRRVNGGKLPLPHEDAGVAELIMEKRKEAAILIAAHHAGLFSADEETKKRDRAFRNVRERLIRGQNIRVAEYTDSSLNEYLRKHVETNLQALDGSSEGQLHGCGFARRLELSCLVDADYGDTARHYGNEVPVEGIPLRWEERLAALDTYVNDLPQASSRDELRDEVYRACRDADVGVSTKSCDAPVGSGKTTAVMANLLQAAIRHELRHIIVVLPYTNIIKQSVKVYRNALALPGENPEDVVAEHHHRADFGSLELRQLATLWKAPVIVTTAVQFFETLGSHQPAQLRKLHELPGSAVFVDEMHTALPSPLWPQVWRWFETWTKEWGGYLILASGSLPRFWELKEFVSEPAALPDILPDVLRQKLTAAEGRRIRYSPEGKIMDPEELAKFVMDKPGPRLLIMNTVQSAAHIADMMRKQGHDVMHLSTALAPEHRDRIVDRVKERLAYSYKDWTLVATSCVEAGMDFSFQSGFRERASAASLIQIGGRVSRGAEYDEAHVWDFRAEGGLLTQNPSLDLPRKVVHRLFESGQMYNLTPSELAKLAMQQELTEKGKEEAEALIKAERIMEYPEVGNLCRVIKTDTRLVVVSEALADRIRSHERISSKELLRLSVQMWTQKIGKGNLPLELLLGSPDDSNSIYHWIAEYDPDFLGYMAGAFRYAETLQTGAFIQ